jgi:hypothetical protein
MPLREELETVGPGKILRSVSGIDPNIEMAVAAEKIFSRLIEKGERSPLLSLEDFFWA